MELGRYDDEIVYRPGKNNVPAGWLHAHLHIVALGSTKNNYLSRIWHPGIIRLV